jgi:HPt (histidine-containing phosphotransfer) domain-containing protein
MAGLRAAPLVPPEAADDVGLGGQFPAHRNDIGAGKFESTDAVGASLQQQLCRCIEQHADQDQDRTVLEQFRPYITMMRSRALASQALRDNEPKAALHAIDQGIDSLRQHFDTVGQPQLFEESSEVEMLRGMREALVPKLPKSQKAELRERLAKALEQENYELAAILRDELKLLKDA